MIDIRNQNIGDLGNRGKGDEPREIAPDIAGLLIAVDNQKGEDGKGKAADGAHHHIDGDIDKAGEEKNGGVVDEHRGHRQDFHQENTQGDPSCDSLFLIVLHLTAKIYQ